MTVPDLTPLNPARILFVKVTKSLFGRKKNKSKSETSMDLRVQSSRGLVTYMWECECRVPGDPWG